MSRQQTQEQRLMQVLVEPIISEKATMLADKANQVAFRVLPDATKDEIKAAVEAFFKVQVTGVQVLNQAGKVKRNARGAGRRSNVRKAYVSLAAGQELNFAQEGV